MSTTETENALLFKDSDGVARKLDGCHLYLDKAGRHWLWSDALGHNLAYKIKNREDTLLCAISSLLFTIKLRDEKIAKLQRIADLAEKFAAEVSPENIDD